MTDIAVADGNTTYRSLDGALLDRNLTVLLAYPASREGSTYQVPDSVTHLGKGAFSSCIFKEIILPKTLVSIGSGAFQSCASLANIILPDSVTVIESNTFDSCAVLTDITLPEQLVSIGQRAFTNCFALVSLHLPDTLKSIEARAFSSCGALTSLTIPRGTETIHSSAFSNCSKLILRVWEGSPGHKFAVDNKIPFELVTGENLPSQPTTPPTPTPATVSAVPLTATPTVTAAAPAMTGKATSTLAPTITPAAATEAPPTESPEGRSYTTLRPGDRSPEVAQMKKRLYELGYFASLIENEHYSVITAIVVRQFQIVNSLTPSGVATPETLSLLYSDSALPKPLER